MIASYIVMAVLLLVITGGVFSAAFADYAVGTQYSRIRQANSQVRLVLADSQEPVAELLVRLQRLFPDMTITWVELPDLPQALRQWRAGQGRPPDAPAPPGDGALGRGLLQATIHTVPLIRNDRIEGGFRLELRAPWQGVIAALYPRVALILLLGLALAGLMGTWFSRLLSRPMGRLAEATAAVTGGDFVQTVDATGIEEIDRLVEQFNRMVLRLRESFRVLSGERDAARRFAADAAHELKTPLMALRNYHELGEGRPDRQEQLYESTGRQIVRLERVIDGLVRLARLSEGSGFVLRAGDLAEAVGELAAAGRAMAEQYGHAWSIRLPEEPVPVQYDPELLELAVMNLVENACKFTPAGGRVEVDLSVSDGWATLAVSDTGPGLDEEQRARLFERFFRGVQTQQIPGSGLGLSIVHEAVSRLGGRVEVESQPGQGSRFLVLLPLSGGEG